MQSVSAVLPPVRTRSASQAASFYLPLADGRSTTVHIVWHRRNRVRARVVAMNRGTLLATWCRAKGATEAIGGGFFLREKRLELGELWLAGEWHQSEPFAAPWNATRGALTVGREGNLAIAARDRLPVRPLHDLLQAGPLLVARSRSLIAEGTDPEGFSAASYQFDTDITVGRYPRAAIGHNAEHIFCVACDGRSAADAGLTLRELADLMVMLGARRALNLDGGSSASLVHQGRLINRPRGDGISYPNGRAIYSAITFEPI